MPPMGSPIQRRPGRAMMEPGVLLFGSFSLEESESLQRASLKRVTQSQKLHRNSQPAGASEAKSSLSNADAVSGIAHPATSGDDKKLSSGRQFAATQSGPPLPDYGITFGQENMESNHQQTLSGPPALAEPQQTASGTSGDAHPGPSAAPPVSKVPPSSWAALLAPPAQAAAPKAPAQQRPVGTVTSAMTSSPGVHAQLSSSMPARPEAAASPAAPVGPGAPPPKVAGAAAPATSSTDQVGPRSLPDTARLGGSQPAASQQGAAAQPMAIQAPPQPPGATSAAVNAESAPAVGRAVEKQLLPRGLVNTGNMCFANATLQALVGSTEFGKLLNRISAGPQDTCPTIGSFSRFWADLHVSPASSAGRAGMAPSRAPQPAAPAASDGPGGAAENGSDTPTPGPGNAAEAPALGSANEADAEETIDDDSLAALAASRFPALASAGRGSKGPSSARPAPPGKKEGNAVNAPRGPGKDAPSYAALARPRVLALAPPLNPTLRFEGVLSRFSPQHHRNGVQIRQEDAQEFLSFLLDRMHEELVAAGASGPEGPWASANGIGPQDVAEAGESAAGDDGWHTVGPKNKTAVTRHHKVEKSDISNIFSGELRSEIKARGAEASVTVDPFSVLQLDITRDSIRSIEDALLAFGAPEHLEGYRPDDGKGSHAVPASRSVKLVALPRVLVLHLMRFTYGARGSAKLHKPVAFPLQLTIPKDLVYAPALTPSAASGSPQSRTYRLCATVVHHGKEPSRGHYTADVRQPDDSWLRFDDANVYPIPPGKVVREQAYLLLYEQVA